MNTDELVFALLIFAAICCNPCSSDGGEDHLVDVIQELQPHHDVRRAAELAEAFHFASSETGIEDLLLIAIGFRESSLHQWVVSSVGARGIMQIHGISLRHRPGHCDHRRDIMCNIRTGAAFLQWCKATCGGSWNKWVGAYGLDHCPSERRARKLGAVRRARAIYRSIGGEDWE